jgi:hypothetical protein
MSVVVCGIRLFVSLYAAQYWLLGPESVSIPDQESPLPPPQFQLVTQRLEEIGLSIVYKAEVCGVVLIPVPREFYYMFTDTIHRQTETQLFLTLSFFLPQPHTPPLSLNPRLSVALHQSVQRYIS